MSNYNSYLSSKHWQELRERVLKRANGRCEGCGAPDRRLHVHHETYERIGKERLADLTALCVACHGREHPDSDWASEGGDWVSERDCPACPGSLMSVRRVSAHKVACMCLTCHREVIAAATLHPREGRVGCPISGCDSRLKNEYGVSQHLRDKHGWVWTDTPAGEKYPHHGG